MERVKVCKCRRRLLACKCPTGHFRAVSYNVREVERSLVQNEQSTWGYKCELTIKLNIVFLLLVLYRTGPCELVGIFTFEAKFVSIVTILNLEITLSHCVLRSEIFFDGHVATHGWDDDGIFCHILMNLMMFDQAQLFAVMTAPALGWVLFCFRNYITHTILSFTI